MRSRDVTSSGIALALCASLSDSTLKVQSLGQLYPFDWDLSSLPVVGEAPQAFDLVMPSNPSSGDVLKNTLAQIFRNTSDSLHVVDERLLRPDYRGSRIQDGGLTIIESLDPRYRRTRASIIDKIKTGAAADLDDHSKIVLAYYAVAQWVKVEEASTPARFRISTQCYAAPLMESALKTLGLSDNVDCRLVTCYFHEKFRHNWLRIALHDDSGTLCTFDMDMSEHPDQVTYLVPRGY